MYIFLAADIYHNSVEGLCGNLNGITQDDLSDVSNGKVAANPQEFGSLWKASNCPDIDTAYFAENPNPCEVSYCDVLMLLLKYQKD